MINKKRVLDEFLELIQIPCETRNEREVTDVLTKKLEHIGCTVVEDNVGEIIGGNAGNLIAELKGNKSTAPKILFSAHMDCVNPCVGIKPTLKDGIITSDGTTILGSDDKAGVVAILETIRILKEKKLDHGDIQIIFSASEEVDLAGSKNIDKEKIDANFAYILDGGGRPGSIINQAPGQNKFTIKVHGKAAHAGLEPEKGINAIVKASELILKLPQGRLDDETTCNIGTIKGGSETNIVPDIVTIEIEARSRDEKKLATLSEDIKNTVEIFSKNITKAEIQIDKKYNAFSVDSNHIAIKIAEKAIEECNIKAKVEPTGGGSDANFYNEYGIPSVILSVGMEQVHTTSEYIREEDLYTNVKILLNIIKNIAQ